MVSSGNAGLNMINLQRGLPGESRRSTNEPLSHNHSYTRLRLEMGNAAQNFILAVWSGGGYATGMLVLAMLMRPEEVKDDDFMYETNNGTITITRYTGSGGSVIIPATITGWPVTCIGVD